MAYGPDESGVDTAYTGTVKFSSSDPQAVLPAAYTFTPADAGVHTFTITLKTSGTQSITVTDTADQLSRTQSIINVQSTTPASIQVVDSQSSVVAGAANSITVTAYDVYGNVATGYTGTVHFTSSDPQASLPNNYTFNQYDAGSHTFSATLGTAGVQSITAVDSVDGYSATTGGVTVTHAPVYSFDVTDSSNYVNTGTPTDFTVTAIDQFGNVITGYIGTIDFTSSDPRAVLPGKYTFTLNNQGSHTFSATLDTGGVQSITATDTVTTTVMGSGNVTVDAASPSATLVKQDLTTEGNWIGEYGSDGYNIIGDATSYPSYAEVTATGESNDTWFASTTDPRGLQNANGVGRLAAIWVSNTSFSINVNLTDGLAHDIALYAVDWFDWGRTEQIQITSAATGAVLDTEILSNFSQGVYLQWQLTGNIVITVKSVNGSAILSGFFFDPVPAHSPPPATATFVQQDSTTQGNWIGKYGSNGYNIIGDATSYPSYATVMATGESTATWASSTTDPRALENAGGVGRLAATWYSSTNFSLNVDLTDGQAHDVTLYALDWDYRARSEQIQISSGITGVVLDTETISNFWGGDYLEWTVSGDVVIKITNLASPNAVLSGLFFDPAAPLPGDGDLRPARHHDAGQLDREIWLGRLQHHRRRDQLPQLRHGHGHRRVDHHLEFQHD